MNFDFQYKEVTLTVGFIQKVILLYFIPRLDDQSVRILYKAITCLWHKTIRDLTFGLRDSRRSWVN